MSNLGFCRRPRPRTVCCALLALALTGAAALQAASTGFWVVATQTDFLKGDTDAVSIDTDGRVTIAPALQVLGDVGTPAVWRIAAAHGQVWAATGHDGKLWSFPAQGPPKVVFDAPELDLQAIAPGPQGSVLVGSAPDGKVYRVAADGTSSTFFDPEDKYIWAIAVAPDGTTYVGTGAKGKVYKVPAAGGAGTLLYDTGTEHVSALAFDSTGLLLVGTSTPGRVVRLDAEGKPFVILEAGYQEVRSLRVTGGVTYATAAGPATSSTPATSSPTPTADTSAAVTMSTEVTVIAGSDNSIVTTSPATSGTESRSSGPQKGAIYRIAADGDWTTVWESPDDVPYDVLAEPGGSLLVGTGAKGKLYRLSGDPILATLVTRADGQQITALADDGAGGIFLGASNPGRVLRLSSKPAVTGSYVSDVRDTTTVATWGTIRWQATTPPGTAIALHTRTGNTRTPDATWSGWSGPYTAALGSHINSPKARYLQWKAVLTGANGASPVLTSVSAAYLPRNTRPIVDSVTVHPPGVVFQRPFPTGDPELAGLDGAADPRVAAPGTLSIGQTLGRRTFQKSLQTFVWSARDTDGDRLQYALAYRREGDRTWTALKDGLDDDVFTWDTTTVPDGTYVIKVMASDSAANPPALALQGERESQSFEIDNTPPTVTVAPAVAGAPAGTIRFTVQDTQTAIQKVEYASAGDRWRQAYPTDGLMDSREERFELVLGTGAKSPVVVRATDGLGNVATAILR
jgi:WD40 repeat protein